MLARTPYDLPSRALRRAGVTAVALALLAGLVACGREDDPEEHADDDSSASASPSSSGTGAGDSGGDYPEFGPTDYTYRLEVLCFCPQVGAIQVTVEDGKVASATSVRAGRGAAAGGEVPDFARLTINDIIAIANDPDVAEVEVTWPDGRDHPTVVHVDRIRNAIDDEVTYTIRRVRVR